MKIHDVYYIYDLEKTKFEQEFLRHFKFSWSAWFEHTREDPNRFLVCRLNHSATTTWVQNYHYRIIFILVFQKIKELSAFDPPKYRSAGK